MALTTTRAVDPPACTAAIPCPLPQSRIGAALGGAAGNHLLSAWRHCSESNAAAAPAAHPESPTRDAPARLGWGEPAVGAVSALHLTHRARARPPPLDQETRSAITTAEAAFHLCRAEQTLRIWACKENGPIRPIRINGRLAWPVTGLRKLLGVA